MFIYKDADHVLLHLAAGGWQLATVVLVGAGQFFCQPSSKRAVNVADWLHCCWQLGDKLFVDHGPVGYQCGTLLFEISSQNLIDGVMRCLIGSPFERWAVNIVLIASTEDDFDEKLAGERRIFGTFSLD